MDWAPYYIGAYLAGSIPFGWLAARANGIDIRTVGSGNIGATNVGRALGTKYAVLVFALDFLKGLVPAWLAAAYAGPGPLPWEVIGIALLAVIGHNYPVWLRFKGGKGVATSAGALTALLPFSAAVAAAVWVVFFFSTRYVSVASLASVISLPIATWFFRPERPCLILAFAIMILGIVRHRSNIAALIAGTEHRFQKKNETSSEP